MLYAIYTLMMSFKSNVPDSPEAIIFKPSMKMNGMVVKQCILIFCIRKDDDYPVIKY